MKKIEMKLLVLTFLLFPFISTINVKAEEAITGKIGLTYQYGGEVFTNRSISIYRVATQDSDGKFIYTDSFQENIKIENLTTSEWRSLALRLSEQVEKNKIVSYDVKTTDENGRVAFENLPLGLYLIKVEEVTKGDYEYLSSPMLITLPNFDEVENDYITEIETAIKTEKRKIPKPPVEKPSSNPYTYDVIMKYVIAFGVSAIVLLFLIYVLFRTKKKTRNENEQVYRKEKEENEQEQEKEKD